LIDVSRYPQAVYGKDAIAPRVFTELGLELPSADFIVSMQSLVVSGGEPFMPPLPNQLPVWDMPEYKFFLLNVALYVRRCIV
jgi:hypothetical protein